MSAQKNICTSCNTSTTVTRRILISLRSVFIECFSIHQPIHDPAVQRPGSNLSIVSHNIIQKIKCHRKRFSFHRFYGFLFIVFMFSFSSFLCFPSHRFYGFHFIVLQACCCSDPPETQWLFALRPGQKSRFSCRFEKPIHFYHAFAQCLPVGTV